MEGCAVEDLSKVQCPHCREMLKEIALQGHLDRVHLGDSAMACPVCESPFRRERLKGHLKSAHGVSDQIARFFADTRPDAVKLIEILAAGCKDLTAKRIEKCDCKKRVFYADAGAEKSKAFDVDALDRILSVHICSGERFSQSVATISAGAVESNRRKH